MNSPALPIVLPLLTALLALFWWRPSTARRTGLSLLALGQCVVAADLLARTLGGETLVLGMGRWTARAGIVLAVDPLGALMVCLSSVTVLLSMLYGFAESRALTEHPLRQPLTQFMLMGINLSFCTGDLFNLFVGFEIMLISSYALLTLEADDWEIKQAYPYLALNLTGSTLFLCAAGLIYAMAGTLNYALLHDRFAEMSGDPRLLTIGLMLCLVFAMKAGLFPLHYWLPHSYPTLATPIAAIYAGLLTKVGVYVLVRVLGTVLPHDFTAIHHTVGWMAGFTLVVGVLGSVARGFMRGMLAFQVIAAVGLMAMPLGWFSVAAVTATVFYLMQDVLVKSGLFLAAGVAAHLAHSDHLKRMGGLWKTRPWLGLVFLALALSLAGLPPFAGFWGKLAILIVGLAHHSYVAIALVLMASLLTLFAMLRIWHHAFWRPAPEDAPAPPRDRRWIPMTAVAAISAAGAIALGVGAEPVYRVARTTAERALDAEGYAQSVLRIVGKDGGR